MRITSTLTKLLLLLCVAGQALAQSTLQWSAWGNSSKVLDLSMDNQYYYAGGMFGVIRMDKSNVYNQTHFHKITTGYNLRDNMVVSVAANADKLILGNYYSFHIYDGTNWQNIVSNSGGAPSFSMGDLYIHTDGAIWVAAQGGSGAHRFNGTSWTSYGTSNSTVGNVVNKIFYHQNKIYFCTNYNGLAWFDGTNWGSYTTSNSGIGFDSYIYDALFDPMGNLWVCSLSGLSKFDGTNWTLYNTSNMPQFYSNQINCLAYFQNKLYVAPAGQLFSYDGTTWTELTSNLPPNFTGVNTMLADEANGKLLMGTNYKDLVIFDGTNYNQIKLSNSGLRSQNVNGMAIDAVTNKKYITEEYMTTFDDVQWGELSAGFNAPFSFTSAVVLAHNNVAYAGAESYLYVHQNGNWEALQPTVPNPFYIYSMRFDANHHVWMTGYNAGLVKYDGNTFTTYNTDNSTIPANNVEALAIAPDNTVWFSIGMSKYLYKFDGLQFIKYDSINASLNPFNNTIKDIAVAQDGKLYCATASGLAQYDPVLKQWSYKNTSNSGIPSNDVKKVVINAYGDVWITAGYNDQFYIARLRDTTWVSFNDANCPLDYIPDDMAVDPQGNIWFARNNLYKVTDTSLPTSLNELNYSTESVVFPNPASAHQSVYVETDKTEWLTLQDITGRVVLRQKVYEGLNALPLHVPAGMYLLSTPGKRVTKLIVY